MIKIKNKKNKHLKKIAIVTTPIVLLCVISYVSITSKPQASESTFAYEHYYEDEAYTDNETDYGININSNGSKEDNTVVDFDDTSEEITDNDSVVLDTNPESITVLVNKDLSLPIDYIPKDLVVPDVLFSIHGFDEKKQMRKEAAEALEKLFLASETENLSLYAVSGYRSYQRQYNIFTVNIRKKGIEDTMNYSAIPGYSEHQTGLSMDVSTKSIYNSLDDSFAETPEGKWIADNAHFFGYIIRYPEDKADITGYLYEPWHIRYVGKALATYLYNEDLSLEEYYSFDLNIDNTKDLSLNDLVDFGIALKDVIVQPTKAIKYVEVKEAVAEPTTDPKDMTTETEDTSDEVIPTKPPKKDKPVTPTPTATPEPTVTPTPTATPKPTATPVPTLAPTEAVLPD